MTCTSAYMTQRQGHTMSSENGLSCKANYPVISINKECKITNSELRYGGIKYSAGYNSQDLRCYNKAVYSTTTGV